nr:hypothetical protein BaRGS_020497 [Batillaria attramentaria]
MVGGGDSLIWHNYRPFTTIDSDHDMARENCAVYSQGAWWFRACGFSHLNDPYLTSAQDKIQSINWYHWKNGRIALKHVEMKIRPAM